MGHDQNSVWREWLMTWGQTCPSLAMWASPRHYISQLIVNDSKIETVSSHHGWFSELTCVKTFYKLKLYKYFDFIPVNIYGSINTLIQPCTCAPGAHPWIKWWLKNRPEASAKYSYQMMVPEAQPGLRSSICPTVPSMFAAGGSCCFFPVLKGSFLQT